LLLSSLISALYRNERLPGIEVEIFGKIFCVADFNPYCSGVSKGKMEYDGYWCYLF